MKNDRNYRHTLSSSDEIATLISRYRASGMGLEQFARKNRIPPGRLHYWLYQKRRCEPAQPSGLAPRFQEVKLAAFAPGLGPWAAEVSLPTGVTVRLSAGAAPGWVGGLVQELRRLC